MVDIAVWFDDPSVEFHAKISLCLTVLLGNKKTVKDNLLLISPTATVYSNNHVISNNLIIVPIPTQNGEFR